MAAGTSYNGWPANDDKTAIDVVPFGDAHELPFPGGVKAGDVWTVLGYVAVQLHQRVEACVAGWDWGYSYKANVNNPSQLSCHASGTAIDYNAPNHPNGSAGTFTEQQVGTIYKILDEVEGAVSWLQGYDEMHFEIQVSAATLAPIAARIRGNNDTGGFLMALTDKQQDDLYDWVKSLHSQFVPSGTAPGQKSAGSTLAASLKQSQANANMLTKIDGKL